MELDHGPWDDALLAGIIREVKIWERDHQNGYGEDQLKFFVKRIHYMSGILVDLYNRDPDFNPVFSYEGAKTIKESTNEQTADHNTHT